jgi:hypothetical protein
MFKPLLAAGCVSSFTWLPRATSTKKHFDYAAAHTRERWKQCKKNQKVPIMGIYLLYLHLD